MDPLNIREFIESNVIEGIIPNLADFIKIPSLSTSFDPEWGSNGYMEVAMHVMINYIDSLKIEGYKYEILKEPWKPWLYFGSLDATDSLLGTV